MTGKTRGESTRRWAVRVTVSVVFGALVVRHQEVIALVAPAMLGVMALVLTVRCLVTPDDSGHQRRILSWTLAGFAAHLVAGLVITNTPSVLAYLGGDAIGYHKGAEALLRHWTDGFPAPVLPSGKHGFYYALAGVYGLFGPHTSAGLVLNATLAAALVPLLDQVTHRLFGPAAARFVPPLAVMMPGLFIWTSQLLKESAMLFLLVTALFCAVKLTERVALGPLVCLGMALALSFTLRSFVALVFAGGLVAAIAFGKNELVGGLTTGLGASFTLAVLIFSFGLGYSGYKAATAGDLAHANLVRQDSSTAGSGFNRDVVDISTPKRAFSYLPKGMASVGLGPFPWEVRGARQLPAVADVVVWWALLPSLWRGHRAAWRIAGRRVLLMTLPALATLALLSLAVANYGTVVRERTQVVVVLIPLIALGLSQRASRRSPAFRQQAVAQAA